MRWYSIPNLFRYNDAPSAASLARALAVKRGHVWGGNHRGGFEIVNIAGSIMKAFGAHDEQYEIRVNSRKFLNFLLNDFLQLSQENYIKFPNCLTACTKSAGMNPSPSFWKFVGDRDKSESLITISRSRNLDELPEAVKAHESAQEVIIIC